MANAFESVYFSYPTIKLVVGSPICWNLFEPFNITPLYLNVITQSGGPKRTYVKSANIAANKFFFM